MTHRNPRRNLLHVRHRNIRKAWFDANEKNDNHVLVSFMFKYYVCYNKLPFGARLEESVVVDVGRIAPT